MQWDAWRTMPHARLWRESDWAFALDTAELASRAFDEDAKVGLLTELRYRQKAMGTTWAARQDMHIRYTEPGSAVPCFGDASRWISRPIGNGWIYEVIFLDVCRGRLRNL